MGFCIVMDQQQANKKNEGVSRKIHPHLFNYKESTD
jgi:hypothetical protein